MRWVWPYLVLAGCYSEGSLEVWVQPGPMTVGEVELYVGIHDPHLGESIRPKSGPLAETVWWKRDGNRDADILRWDDEAMARGAVRYQLLADDLDDVRALVAVGYSTDGGGKKVVGVATYLHDVEIGSGEIHRRYMTLGDFDMLPRLSEQEPRPNVPGIQIWGPPEDPSACVQIDNAPELDLEEFGTKTAASSMIVTHGDPDCDGFTITEQPDKNECRPAEYNGFEPRTLDSLSCFDNDMVAPLGTTTSVRACVAGGRACQDGPGERACERSGWCVPTQLCGPAPGDPVCPDFQCDDLQGVVRVDCAFSFDPNNGRWCGGTSEFTLASYFPGVQCDPERATKLRRMVGQTWMETLVYGTGDEMWISVDPKTPSLCEVEVKATGPLQLNPLTNSLHMQYPLAIAFPLTAPVDGRGLALPLVVRAEPTQDCAGITLNTCQVLPANFTDPGLKACIAAPLDPAHRVE